MLCNSCGSELPVDSLYCKSCGTFASRSHREKKRDISCLTKLCNTCGSVLPGDSLYCKSCGTFASRSHRKVKKREISYFTKLSNIILVVSVAVLALSVAVGDYGKYYLYSTRPIKHQLDGVIGEYRGDHYEKIPNGYGEWVGKVQSTENDETRLLILVYEGYWLNGRRHGAGTYFRQLIKMDGQIYWVRYEGEWKDDMKHGHGKEWDSLGMEYTGEWVYDHEEGLFTVKDREGHISTIKFNKGIPIID